MIEAPKISVIIATYHRYDLLVGCLRALAEARRVGRTTFEIIVVDDGGGLSRAIEQEVGGLEVRWLYLRVNLGQPGAQVAGVALALGEILAFLDDDAEIAAGWVDAIWNYFQNCQEPGAVLGRIIPIDGSHLLARMRQQIYEHRHSQYTNPEYCNRLIEQYHLTVNSTTGLSNHISGGNFAIRRSALDAVGSLDPSIRLGADDWLSMRLLDAGIPIGYCPEMLIRHHHNRSYRVLFRNNITEGRDRIRILRRGGASRGNLIVDAFTSLALVPFRIREIPEMLQADALGVRVYVVFSTVQFFDAVGRIYEAIQ